MTVIFDGKNFAAEKEEGLKEKVRKLKQKPKLLSILVGNDPASVLYTNLKQKAARRIGSKFQIYNLEKDVKLQEVVKLISELNEDKTVNGIMVQLPLPPEIRNSTSRILSAIKKEKDVDGLKRNSPFMPAAVRAVKDILQYAVKDLPYYGKKAVVIGAKGTVGKGVVKELEKSGYKVGECDKETRDLYAKLTNADLIVSATGVPGLIKPEMVKEGVIAIDVGSPKGDFDKEVANKASFITPVPGGVGPVTVISLLENLVEAMYK